MVDLLIEAPGADAIVARLTRSAVHVPGHFDAEVLSAIAGLTRARQLSDARATEHIAQLATAPYLRHETAPLVTQAWLRSGNMRVSDALYVELSARLGLPLVTTDAGLAASAPNAELIRPA